MTSFLSTPKITWQKLPDDFQLPDDPVDNINQPPLAAALTDALDTAGRLTETTLVTTNYAICAVVDGKTVVKAPDWALIPEIRVSKSEIDRSYTPQIQGDFPAIVLEFLSETEVGEYSSKPTYPPGKWFFYEQVLRVPYYGIFEPGSGGLEVYRLGENGQYRPESPNSSGRYWIASMDLFLGVWYGTREIRSGAWLRWWTPEGQILPWALELANQAEEQIWQTAQNLRALGMPLEQINQVTGLPMATLEQRLETP